MKKVNVIIASRKDDHDNMIAVFEDPLKAMAFAIGIFQEGQFFTKNENDRTISFDGVSVEGGNGCGFAENDLIHVTVSKVIVS